MDGPFLWGDNLLRLSNITKQIDGVNLYQKVSLTAEAGEPIALIGANGTGKTTLLKILAGALRPDQGSIRNPFGDPAWYHDPDPGLTGSWGQRAWMTLEACLRTDPRFILLDEPTRHLDDTHQEALARWLLRLSHSLQIIVSHDLAFLNQVATRTWWIRNHVIEDFGGPPEFALQMVEQQEQAYRRAFEAQERETRRLFTDIQATKEQARRTESGTIDSDQRRLAKKVAKKAKSREMRLTHRMESEEYLKAPLDAHSLRFTWDHIEVVPRVVWRVEDGEVGWTHPLLRHLWLTLKGGDRVRVTGPNGSGKTSLLGAMCGNVGRRAGYFHGPLGTIGRLYQVVDAETTDVLTYFRRGIRLPMGRDRAWLQAYGFSAKHLSQQVSELSDGERMRLNLSRLTATGVPTLILDEPEHHLDEDSLEAICRGLRRYPGTLVVVSHHETLCNSLGLSIRWHVDQGTVAVTSVP